MGSETPSSGDDEAPVLDVEDLDVAYGSVPVLFECALRVEEGQSLAILGTNGAGKTTLLRAILGLSLPSRGVIRHRGQEITRASVEERFHRGIVAVRGGEGVFAGLSVRENFDLSFTNRPEPAEDRRQRVEAVLEVFPVLQERLDDLAGDLSGGQRQQLALARALVLRPDLLVIDELSLGLAPVVVQSLIEVVEDLRTAGQTMVIVEQSMNLALAVCDGALYLEKGSVVFDGPADELRRRPDLADTIFLGAGAAR